MLGALHGYICKLPKVNDIAVGIAFMSFGTGLAFFFGKPFIQPSAPQLDAIHLGDWTGNSALAQALQVNPLFFVGIVLAVVMWWALKNTKWGLIVRMAGDSAASAKAMGVSVDLVRFLATAAGGFLAGIGGAFLSLYYPGIWNQGLSQRAGADGGGAGDLCALGPDPLHLRRAAVRRGGRHRPVAAIGRHHAGLLLLQRRALHPDARSS